MGSNSIFRKVKVRSINIYTVIFSFLFAIGILGGSSIGRIYFYSKTIQVNQMIAEKSTKPRNGQKNLLMIAVQDLNSPDPVLESVWLLISLPRNRILNLIPILPNPNSANSTANLALLNTFSLTSKNVPDSAFFDQLHEEFWWDNYLLIDKVSITRILDTIYQISAVNTGIMFDSIPSTWENPTEAFHGQTELLRTICDQFKSFPNSDKTEILFQKIGDHIQTDLDWSDFIEDWSNDRALKDRLECEFPTLVLENQ